jgi:hypothetical protein
MEWNQVCIELNLVLLVYTYIECHWDNRLELPFYIVVKGLIHNLKIENLGSKWVGHLAYENLTRFGER